MNNGYTQKVISFYRSHKRMPTYAEMLSLFGFKSKNAVARIVTKMVAAGSITKDKLGKLIPGASFDSIPLLGSVKAGFPSSVDELDDSLNIEEYLVGKRKDSTYMVEVDGDSMIDAHIADGDIVIAERTNVAHDGQIVIAQIDGEFTMKYFRQSGTDAWLEPANKNFKPIYPKHELLITAVIKGVVRRY